MRGATLRFLDSPEAALELARHLGSRRRTSDSRRCHMGVLGSPYRKQLLPLDGGGRLTAPDQPVWDRYLDTLSRLSQQVSPGGPARNEYAARLICFPALKTNRGSCDFDEYVGRFRTSGHADATVSASFPVGRVHVLSPDFRSLPPRMQGDRLVSRWNIIGGPAMLPVLHFEIYRAASETACRSVVFGEMVVRRRATIWRQQRKAAK